MTFIGLALLVAGSAFSLLAAIGLLRFPDFYTRLHVGAKAGPLGAGLILLSVAATSADGLLAIRCVVGFVFLIMVSPIWPWVLYVQYKPDPADSASNR